MSEDITPLTVETAQSSDNCLESIARKRWKLVADVLIHHSKRILPVGEHDDISIRRFKTFNLLREENFIDHKTLSLIGCAEKWIKYHMMLGGESTSRELSPFWVNVHKMECQLSAHSLIGFNNTGNICVWPAEESLSAFVLSDLAAYENKRILELGGGFSCLAGLFLAKYGKPFLIHLTDGNELSVENVKKNVWLNQITCYTKVSMLKWQDLDVRIPAEKSYFDVILAADCLFFDDSRSALIDTICFFLAKEGVSLIMAPKRGKTMALFIEECNEKGLWVEIKQRYNETIWKRHLDLKHSDLYDENLHYPLLLYVTKL